ncbi:MAG TPA: hypothetical protein VJ729_16930 [Nitrososphaeraceae archaeon]|nr:hypothetical protein [Nitrososphaeraceae archaeon]
MFHIPAAAAGIINARVPYLYNYKFEIFRQAVLDKYRDNKFCDTPAK